MFLRIINVLITLGKSSSFVICLSEGKVYGSFMGSTCTSIYFNYFYAWGRSFGVHALGYKYISSYKSSEAAAAVQIEVNISCRNFHPSRTKIIYITNLLLSFPISHILNTFSMSATAAAAAASKQLAFS